MRTTRGRSRERRPAAALTLSRREVAFVAGVSKKTVDLAIERRELMLASHEVTGGARRLGAKDALYMRLRKETGDLLSPRAKRRLYGRLEATTGAPSAVVEIGLLSVPTAGAWESVRERLELVRRAREAVEIDPEVRGGEPVVRGTRIPVQMLADFVRQGESKKRILEDYPALTEEALDAALLHAQLYPRRGRPRRAPWRVNEPRRVFRPEDPAEGR